MCHLHHQQQHHHHQFHQCRHYHQRQGSRLLAAAAAPPTAAAAPAPAATAPTTAGVSGIRHFSLPYPRGPGGWSQNKAAASGKASFYDVTVERYAALPMTAMTMQHMMQFGEHVLKDPSYLLRQARFVHRELPIRLAKRLMDLQFLPYIVVTNPHIKQVYDSYRRALDLLVALPEVRTQEDNEKFTELLALLVEEHTPLIGVLARGVRECSIRPLVGRELNLDGFLDNMLRSRISRRVVAEQHIALQQKRPGFIGVICTNMSVREVVEDAVEEATDMCTRTFGCCPEFVLTGDLSTTFAYIPSHLHYMLFEILKNASRAIVEHHTNQSGDPVFSSASFPPVVVTVCSGSNEVTIKVSDLGGGIPEKLQAKVWRYGYSSVEGDVTTSSTLRSAAGGPVDSQGTPMAGLGFGLPYSRLLAQYLGGNIEMVSIPGYGSDVYVRVRRVVDQTEAVEI
ncbi:hypothetical protein CLOP_g23026 [Closterium sp. NIES-67]|nr:hypothetical protein CLOP_g23026 [Closterium sp. NIES-67]